MTYYISATRDPSLVVHRRQDCPRLQKAQQIIKIGGRECKRRKRCRFCCDEEDQAIDRD